LIRMSLIRKEKTEEGMNIPSNCSKFGIIRFEVDNVSKVNWYGAYSHVVEIGGVKWKATVCKRSVNGEKTNRLFVILMTENSQLTPWNIHLNTEYVLVNSDSRKSIIAKVSTTLNNLKNFTKKVFLNWSDLIDAKMGFIRNNKITVKIGIWIIRMTGIGMPPTIKMDMKEELKDAKRLPVDCSKSGVILLEVDEMSTLDDGSVAHFSPEIEVGGVSWCASVRKEKRDASGKDSLLAYLFSRTDEWSVHVENVIFTLVHSDSSKNIVEKMRPVTYHPDQESWGLILVKWEELIDEKRGFIKDNKITIEIQFTISNMKRFKSAISTIR
ncbi:hypothetical protein PENTCL1PPCAC_23249, partial [Pristionchus entomophagus]